MNKIEKIIILTNTIIMALVLSRFSISKLAGWEISVNAFIEMAKPLGINPSFFRISTGFVILIVCIAYLATAFFTFFQNKVSFSSKLNYHTLSIFANTLGLLTMIGALLSEFFLRLQAKWPLVYIAIGIILFSILNIYITKKHRIIQ